MAWQGVGANLCVRPIFLGIVIFLLLLLFPGVLFAQEKEPLDLGAHCPGYKVRIKGVGGKKDVLEGLRAAANTVVLVDTPPPTVAMLKMRAEGDIPDMVEVLHSQGYFDGTVKTLLHKAGSSYVVTFLVDLKKPYLLSDVKIALTNTPALVEITMPPLKTLGLQTNQVATFGQILDAQDSLVRSIQEQGYPFASLLEREVTADYATKNLVIYYVVDVGERARFGRTEVVGLKGVKEDFVRDNIAWEEGDLYDPQLVQGTTMRLQRYGLFSMVNVAPSTVLDPQGLMPMKISMEEAKRRTIALRAGYDTVEEWSGGLTWEHRNIFGGGEKLRGELYASGIRQTAEGFYILPLFEQYGQSLEFNARVTQDRPDAYNSHNVRLGAIVARELTPHLRIGGGPAYTWAQVEQKGNERIFNLLSAPLFARWDNLGDLPKEVTGGTRFLNFEPFIDIVRDDFFLKSQAQVSQVFRLLRFPLLTIGGRANVGSLTAASVDGIPADIRYYAGGPGSIRGYAYQSVGPLDGKDPIGGRSVMTTAFEVNLELYKPLGIMGFLDGGSSYTQTTPNPAREYLWGTGVGLSYFSPMGPLSVGIGFPLDRRPGIDRAYQFFVSIGYTF